MVFWHVDYLAVVTCGSGACAGDIQLVSSEALGMGVVMGEPKDCRIEGFRSPSVYGDLPYVLEVLPVIPKLCALV